MVEKILKFKEFRTMTKEKFYDGLIYHLVFDNGVQMAGTFDKIGNHLTDFDNPTLKICKKQPSEFQAIVNKYYEDNPDGTLDGQMDAWCDTHFAEFFS